MSASQDPAELLNILDLPEYETQALQALFELGRTTAPDLADATGIPKARIYDVLDTLADSGYIKVIPGRPKEHEAKPPGTVLDVAIENARQTYESYKHEVEKHRDAFVGAFQPVYEQSKQEVSPTEELFHVVDVGDPSERETRSIYRGATDQIHVLTKSFEYFEAVEPAVQEALARDLELRVLFLTPELLSSANRDVQRTVVEQLQTTYDDIDIRFNTSRLPWRGTIADPSPEYASGNAIILVEEKEIPLHKRQAAVTDNGSFVAGLNRYFELSWQYDAQSPSEVGY